VVSEAKSLVRRELGLSGPTEDALEKNLVQFYDSLAAIYDDKYENPSIGYMRHVESSVISRHIRGRQMRILDLGCGTGSSAVYLAKRNHEVVGVDISPEMIAAAQLRAAGAGVESRTTFLVANIQHLPPLPGRFGLALSTFGALNHVRDLKATFRGLAPTLTVGSRFVFSLANMPDRFSRKRQSDETESKWKRLEMKEVGKAVWTRFYNRSEVEVALCESGFRPLHVAGIFYLVRPSYEHSNTEHLRPTQSLMTKVESLIRWHGPANHDASYLLFVAQKNEDDR
jgi:ubiquinone/menaquinone biosynthesis C-methylase UbiE